MQSRTGFIVGCWRSGTTWVNRLLASHEDVLGVPETHMIGRQGRPSAASCQEVANAHFWKVICDGVGTDPGPCAPDPRPRGMELKLLELIGEQRRRELLRIKERMESFTSWDDVVRETFRVLDGVRPLIVEKTPGNVLFLPSVRSLFPEARVIGIVRDPRDVLASVTALDRPWAKRITDDSYVARYWATCLGQLGADAKEHQSTNMILRYEDLKADFPLFATRLLQFLGLSTEGVAEIEAHNTFEAYTGRKAGEQVSGWFYRKGVAGGFLEDIGIERAVQMQAMLEPLMRTLGYELVQPESTCEA